jgi:hypothetical protein
MRLLGLGTALSLAAVTAACAPAGQQACREFGLSPGTPEFQRCQAAKEARGAAATRGAMEMIRSLDQFQPGMR